MRYTAKEFFESVRAAAIDAERCRTQLEALEGRALLIGGGSMEPRATSGIDPDKLPRRVAALVDMESQLEGRIDADYDLIDRACAVLYGDDQMGGGGLYRAKGGTWADVLWWRFCAAVSWDGVARAVGESERTCQHVSGRALQWMDRYKFMDRVMNAEALRGDVASKLEDTSN